MSRNVIDTQCEHFVMLTMDLFTYPYYNTTVVIRDRTPTSHAPVYCLL